MRHKGHILSILGVITQLIICPAHGQEKQPNIILIMADDLGYECIGANGCDDYKTPVLDKLAATGIRFSNCFANPLCTPSRVKIIIVGVTPNFLFP